MTGAQLLGALALVFPYSAPLFRLDPIAAIARAPMRERSACAAPASDTDTLMVPSPRTSQRAPSRGGMRSAGRGRGRSSRTAGASDAPRQM